MKDFVFRCTIISQHVNLKINLLFLGFDQNQSLKDKKILDINCGRGGGCAYLRSLGAQIQGYDPSEINIKFCQAKYP